MQTKLLKIKLKPGNRKRVDDLLNFMKQNIANPKNEMTQKGYFWDSVFYDIESEHEYLYIVLKSEDFSKIMIDESALTPTVFRDYYEKFRQDCWAPEKYLDIEALFCFNQAMVFDA